MQHPEHSAVPTRERARRTPEAKKGDGVPAQQLDAMQRRMQQLDPSYAPPERKAHDG